MLRYSEARIGNSQERETHHQSDPEEQIPNSLIPPHNRHPPNSNHRQLNHLPSATTSPGAGQLTCIKKRYGLIFLDTTAITNS